MAGFLPAPVSPPCAYEYHWASDVAPSGGPPTHIPWARIHWLTSWAAPRGLHQPIPGPPLTYYTVRTRQPSWETKLTALMCVPLHPCQWTLSGGLMESRLPQVTPACSPEASPPSTVWTLYNLAPPTLPMALAIQIWTLRCKSGGLPDRRLKQGKSVIPTERHRKMNRVKHGLCGLGNSRHCDSGVTSHAKASLPLPWYFGPNCVLDDTPWGPTQP